MQNKYGDQAWYIIINRNKYGDHMLYSIITVAVDRYALVFPVIKHFTI